MKNFFNTLFFLNHALICLLLFSIIKIFAKKQIILYYYAMKNRKNYTEFVYRDDECVIFPETGISILLVDKEDSFRHSHDYFELFYIISGNITHIINNEQKTLSMGDCVLIKALTDNHSFKRNNSECLHRDIVITKDIFHEICNLLPPLYEQIFSPEFINTIKLSQQEIIFLEEKLRYFSNETEIIKKKTIGKFAVLFILEKFYEKINFPSSEQRKYDNDPIIADIIESFSRTDNLRQNISQIIMPLGYTHSYLCKYFKAHTGKTLTEYFNLIKLSHAAYYLECTARSVQQICDAVGFNSISYFNKIFKNKYGSTPSEYRKQKQNQTKDI